MSRIVTRLLLVILSACFAVSVAFAHESWISRGGHKNGAGEWCCGEGDCFALDYTPRITVGGIQLEGGETVPFSEVQPSPDGTYVRCHRPDGSRRCFFGPRPQS